MSRGQVLSIFRLLRRTIKTTFAGDGMATSLANTELKTQFRSNKNLTNHREIQSKLAEALDAVDFLKHNVVQATKSSCGQFEVSPERAQTLKDSLRS